MCCLDDQDESAPDPDNDASQSQHTEGSYSQSLGSRRAFERDDQSLAESRAESRATSRASSSRAESRADSSRIGSQAESRAESRALSSTIHGPNSDSDKSDSEDEIAGSAVASSVASLFGSVVRNVGPQTTDAMSRRSTRRRMQSPEVRRASRNEEGHGSDASRDLLADSTDDEEEELQELDVSTRRNTSNNDTDRGNTSSPELVYGRQN